VGWLSSTCEECERIRALIEQLEAIEREVACVDPGRRDKAVEQVASLKGQLLDVLSDVLASGDGAMRRAAAYGLSKLQDLHSVPLLVAALGDSDETVRGWVVEALAACSGSLVVGPLVRALADQSVYVYYSACNALKAIRADDVWPALEEHLQSPEATVRKRIAKLLGDMGEYKAVPRLVSLTRDSDPGVRYEAVEALRKIGDSRAVDALIGCLNDESHEVRCGAVQALRWAGDLRAVEPLVAVCVENEELRLLAIQALREIAGDEAISPVVHALRQSRELVRATATEILGTSQRSKRAGVS
jgi:HEAT repeat protein